MPKLVLLTTRGDPTVFSLRDGITSIGRAPGREVLVTDDRVSRWHATLELHDGVAVITDHKSRNGTFVRDVQIREPTVLHDGDELRCGDVRFRYVGESETLETPSMTSHPGEQGTEDPAMLVSAAHSFLQSSEGDRAMRRLELLRVLARLLSGTTSIAELQAAILHQVADLVPVHRAVFLEVEGDGLRVAASYDAQGSDQAAYSQQVVDHVLKHREAALFEDAQADVRLQHAESVFEYDVRCAMAAPLTAGGDVLGVLYVDNSRGPGTYRQADLDLLAVVAGQAAMTLRNARLQRLRTVYERFFPPTVISRLMASSVTEAAELEVTVLFADISGFTAMCETMAPTDVVGLLNDYFPVMSRIVFEREGMLEKYIGDALMAAWGVPLAQADDADRAIDAAVHMQRHAESLGIQIHVGVHTGTVAFARIGSDAYLQFALIGDATNLSSRVCHEAPPGEIYLTHTTRTALTRAWTLEDVGEREVRGRHEPVHLTRVLWQR